MTKRNIVRRIASELGHTELETKAIVHKWHPQVKEQN
jgi:hypothetical protein